jgi:hypothetical protein
MRGLRGNGRAPAKSGRRRIRAAIQEPCESADGVVYGGISSDDGVMDAIPP